MYSGNGKIPAFLGVAAVALGLMPALAQADASNYNYLQLDYRNGEIGGFDMHGWHATGSFRFLEDFFIAASRTDSELNEEIPDFRFDSNSTTASLGFIFAENATASIFGSIGYREDEDRTRFQGDRSEEQLDGYDLGLGARINLSPEAELRLGANHVDFGDGNDLTIPSVALLYKFTRRVAGNVDYQRKDGYDTVGLGFRFYF